MIARENDAEVAALRRALGQRRGRDYWRSLEEFADTPAFQRLIEEDFPRLAPLWEGRVTRRGLLGLMAASLALGGLTACGPQPPEQIAPYTRRPEDLLPGRPRWYASTLPLDGYARGVLVKTFEGRPVKIEGNPEHPASLGATDSIAQAELLGLYDPDRSRTIRYRGSASSQGAFLEQLDRRRSRWAREGGLCLLTGPLTSPSQRALIERLRRRYPGLRWYRHAPLDGAGDPDPRPAVRYRLDRARVILDLDADCLDQGPAKLVHARHVMGRRHPDPQRQDHGLPNRLYCVESTPSVTGASSDHRLPLAAPDVPLFAAALGRRLGVPGLAAADDPAGVDPAWLDALADDLRQAGDGAAVIPGRAQSADLHRLALALNQQLGAVGHTVLPAPPLTPADGDLPALAQAIDQGRVDGLLMLDTNPVYSAPGALEFADRLARVPFSVHLGQYHDETGRAALWHLPAAHPLERWDDARAFDGTASVLQPTIVPLFGGFSAQQVLAAFDGDYRADARELVRAHWRRQWPDDDFEGRWRAALQRGWIEEAPAAPAALPMPTDLTVPVAADDGLVLQWRADPALHDGHYANNGWLQELPRPLTKLTWDGAALIAPALAAEKGLRRGQHVILERNGRRLEVPVWIQPGQPPRAVTLYLGQGRTAVGRVGDGVGVNAYRLMPASGALQAGGLTLLRTDRFSELADTQQHHRVEGRDVLKETDLDGFLEDPAFARPAHPEPPPSLYPEWDYPGHAWGMSINLNSCTGCNACVTACQAENNIPIVGAEEVRRGHEMHWIRVDRYFQGPAEAPETRFQPVPCMHCEKAPCEYVCPVEATQHNSEGLNDMVYNRCVGTRYCSQNCPYKVRRFNWYHYTDTAAKLATPAAAHNPDVTVRSRGVMEKCTYCVQRINQAEADARNAGRPLRDGELKTACQQVCPTGAIEFGDLNDPRSAVSRAKASVLDYAMLGELNTRPRTTYQAEVRNPNPAIREHRDPASDDPEAPA
ncbi:TAT-variant-translocated molybdopterin oxidoreductase [Alcanivorax marinus]|nr:TAT-variant-translocated molybdopterin oxidoreductase [Alloalcanivorax marinus]